MFTAPPFEVAIMIVLGAVIVIGSLITILDAVIKRRRGG